MDTGLAKMTLTLNYSFIPEDVKATCVTFISQNMHRVTQTAAFTHLPQELMLEVIQQCTAKLHIS